MQDIAGDIPQAKSIPVTAPPKSTVTIRIEPDGRTKRLHGRTAWMMRQLVYAGRRGVSPLDLPTGVRLPQLQERFALPLKDAVEACRQAALIRARAH